MKRIISAFLAFVSLLCVCSCGKEQPIASKKYALPPQMASIESGLICENNNFMLTYDASVDNLILYEKSNGKLMSTIPYEYYSSTEESIPFVDTTLNSAVVISCINNKDSSLAEYSSYDSVVQNGKAYSVKIDNGVRVIYFFEEAQISVPVDYTLTEKGIRAKILVSEITEGSQFRVYKIDLLPFFASAKNNTDSYLFIPSGSGALMYTDDTKRNIRMYSEAVFGTDATYDTVYNLNKTDQIYLPVFGAKNKDQGVLAILEEGSELAYIEAMAGDAQIGFSSVYPSYYLRAKDIAKIKNNYGANQVVNKIDKNRTFIDNISVEYICLNSDASYNAMASAYRDYLKNKGYFKSGEKEGYLYLDFLGGALVNKSFLGISYKSLKATTTVSDAQEIINDVSSYAENGLVAVLKGFGDGGIDKTVLGGGFKLDSSLGKGKELSALVQSCDKNGIALAMDFDLIHYTKSGKGFSTRTDSARNLNNTTAKTNYFTLVTNQINTLVESPILIKRSLIEEAAIKSIEYTKKIGFKGISFGTLGKVTYGDYSQQKYYVKANTVTDFEKIAKKLKKNKLNTFSNSANSYAAINSDYIFNSPTSSSKYIALDKDIPFYQMIFKGNTSLSTAAINLAANPQEEFLKAVSTGSALHFTVISKFDTALISSVHSGLSGSVYEDLKQTVADMYKKAEPLLKKVKGAEIVNYSEENGVGCTEFNNGVKVFVNFNDFDAKTESGTVKANDFIYS